MAGSPSVTQNLDEELKRAQLAAAQVDLDLKKLELSNRPTFWKSVIANPIVLGAIITAFVAFNSALISYISSRQQANLDEIKLKSQLQLDRVKMESQLKLDRTKMETELVLKLISNSGDGTQTAADLKFFLDSGYLSDPTGNLSKYLGTLLKGERGAILPAK